MAHLFSTLAIATVLTVLTVANGHSFMTIPQQRGMLLGHSLTPWLQPIPGISRECRDWGAHFPAGDKNQKPGSGHRSQINALKKQGAQWSEFKPMDPNFHWRAGVCGDNYGVNPQDHLRGGKYYCDAHRVATYTQGQVIEVTVNVVAHHNGYMQLHACDVSKCGGEISPSCFRNGHCKEVRRASNPLCDSGNSPHCGPIDRKNPGRWVFPCTDGSNSQRFGGQYAKFKLPDNMFGDHIVLHWFHTAANTCNQPGLVEYFDGPDRPKTWGQCPGQGGAKGGVTRVQKACGGDRVPEEYLQCADVRILQRKGGAQPAAATPTATPAPVVTAPEPTPAPRPAQASASPSSSPAPSSKPVTEKQGPANQGPFVEYVLFGKMGSTWNRIGVVNDMDTVNIANYNGVAIEAVTSSRVRNVKFYADNAKQWTEWSKPYFLGGDRNGRAYGWGNPVLNRYFQLKAVSGTDGAEYSIQLKLQS